jgi:hypothetical protein
VELGAAAFDPEQLLAALLAGPTAEEQAQGLWSAIPAGTTLDGVELVLSDVEAMQSDRKAVVRLRVPPQALSALDHGTFEVIVEQIGLAGSAHPDLGPRSGRFRAAGGFPARDSGPAQGDGAQR